MPDTHAKLSASGAKKWMNCPGSVALEAQMPDKPSEFAAEGTTAHALGEAKIRLAVKEYTRAKYHRAIRDLSVDEEMEEYTDSYRDFVLEQLNETKRETPDAQLYLETRLAFSNYVPDGFGTGDCIILGNSTLKIIDLKYGKGVTVEAENNPQLRLYALGALEAFGYLYDFTDVELTIFQPRKDNIATERLTVKELLEWGESIKPLARKAFDGTEECFAGVHCDTGFCKARAVCRAYADKKLELAKYDFQKPNRLTLEEVSEILDQSESLSKWAALVKDWALEEALQGAEIPGYKVVEGRSNRAFTRSDTEVAHILTANGFPDDDIWPRKLKPLGALEKYLGKKDFDRILGGVVDKPIGKPALVPITDKRPALHSTEEAIRDFESMIEQ